MIINLFRLNFLFLFSSPIFSCIIQLLNAIELASTNKFWGIYFKGETQPGLPGPKKKMLLQGPNGQVRIQELRRLLNRPKLNRPESQLSAFNNSLPVLRPKVTFKPKNKNKSKKLMFDLYSFGWVKRQSRKVTECQSSKFCVLIGLNFPIILILKDFEHRQQSKLAMSQATWNVGLT